jgi:endonuclease III
MKDSGKYSKKVQELYRLLKRRSKRTEKVLYDEPVEAIVYAIISENSSQDKANSAMKRIADNFVDFNDLRVSRPEEIVDVLAKDMPASGDTALRLISFLTAVFTKYNMVTLKTLKKIGKRPAREALEKMEAISRFAVDYCMLTSLNGHAIPLTQGMVEYLRRNELVHPEAGQQQISGFLARQISAENAYPFYTLLRRLSETHAAGTKTKTKAARTVRVKTKAAKKNKK